MRPMYVKLTEAAEMKGCTPDYLLALGEATRLKIVARLKPFIAVALEGSNPELGPKKRRRDGYSYALLDVREIQDIRATGETALLYLPDPNSLPQIGKGTRLTYRFSEPMRLTLDDLVLNEETRCNGVRFLPPSLVPIGGSTPSPDAPPNTAADQASPAGHDTKLLRILRAASEKWWELFDPSDPSTAPTNKQVTDWLVKQGVTSNIASSMATILRADGLKTGRR
jgi:hypothetical protein